MAGSHSVDERVVQMRFDNSDFESKVARTLESLTKLRENSKMEDAGKGMENLSKGVKNVDINSLAASVEQLNNKFSALGIMGQEVFRNLADSAMKMGTQIVNSITLGPRDGWKEYELYTDSVKNILNSAKDAQGLPVTLEAVNKSLAELNRYSDKTIYSFSDMTQNIGKFTNAGVDLETSVKAIQGVANVAALSGANANDAARAMYNFGQALGSGVVKRIDWNSIVNANMSTQDFKQSLIDTAEQLGVLKKVGDKWTLSTLSGEAATKKAFDANENFLDSLSDEWMTAEVLTKTLNRYANEQDELGKKAMVAAQQVTTFSKLMDTLQESMGSGWMNIWQAIFGDYDEQTKLWTGVFQELDGIISGFFSFWVDTEKKSGVLDIWKQLGGRSDLIQGFSNLWAAAKEFVVPIRDLFLNLLPPVSGESLAKLTNGFKVFTERLAPAKKAAEDVGKKVQEVKEGVEDVTERAEKFNQVVQEILDGKWGNGQERIDKLKEAGFAFENLQNAVNGTLGSTKRYETTMSDNEAVNEKVAESTKELVEKQVDYKEAIEDSKQVVWEHSSAIDNMAYVVLGVGSAFKLAIAVVNKGVETFKKFSGGIHPVAAAFNLLMDIFGNIGRNLYSFNTWLMSFNSLGDVLAGLKSKVFGFSKSIEILGGGSVGKHAENLRNLFARIGDVVVKLKKRAKEAADSLRNMFSNKGLASAKEALNNMYQIVGKGLFMVLNQLAGILNTVLDNMEKLWTAFNNLPIVVSLSNAIAKAKDSIVGFWESLKGSTKGSETFSNVMLTMSKILTTIGTTVSTVLTYAFNGLLSVLNKVGAAAQHAFDVFSQSGVAGKANDILQRLKATFFELPDIVARFFESLKSGKVPSLAELSSNLSGFVESIKSFATGISGNIGTLWGDLVEHLVNGITSLSNLQLPEGLQKMVEKIKGVFAMFGDLTGDASSIVQQFITKVVNVVKGLDLRGGFITALIGAIGLFVLRWSRVGKNASKALKSLSTFIKNGGKAANTAAEKFNGFLKVAAGIALIAGSIYVLAQVPADRFKVVAITLAGALLLMVGSIVALTKLTGEGDQLKNVGLAFLGIGAGVALLAAAVAAFAKMDPLMLAKGLGIVAVAVVGMVAALKIVGDVSDGAGAAFAGLAAGVLILSIAVRSFAAIKFGDLVKGGLAVTYFVLLMTGAMKIADGASGDGFINLAAAILILSLAVMTLGKMKLGALVKGGVAVVALIAAMAIASRQAKDVDGASFKAMSSAIKMLTIAFLIMSKIPTLQLIVISASIVLIFRSLTNAMKVLKEMDPKDSLKVAFALVALLAPIGLALGLLAHFSDPDAVLKIALGIAAVLWALGQAGPGIAALSKIDFKAGLKAIALADIFFVSVAALLGALGAINNKMGGAAGDSIVEGANIIGRAIHGFIEGLIFGDTDPSAVLQSIGNAITGFVEQIQGFIEMLKGLDPSVGENAKNLAVAILAICGAEVLDAIGGWVMGKSNFDGFGDAVKSVTSAIMDINESVKGGNFDNKGVKQVIKAIKSMIELADSLPRQGGLAQKLIGVKDLGNFGAQMANFMNNGFSDFARKVKIIGPLIEGDFAVKVLLIKTATKALSDLANDIPKTKSDFMAFFTGKQDLGEFAKQMAKFMGSEGGFPEFLRAVNTMPTCDVGRIRGEIKPATVAMIELADELKKNSTILTYFTGNSDLSMFGTSMAGFGRGLKEFAESITGVSLENVTAVREVIEKYGDLNANSNLNENGLYTFSTTITNFGAAFAMFYESISGVAIETITQFIDKITDLHNLLVILSATDYSGVGNFTTAMQQLAASGVDAFLQQFTADTARAAEAANALVDAITTGILLRAQDFYGAGAEAAAKFCTGLTVGFGGVNITAGEVLVAKALVGVQNKLPDFSTKGNEGAVKFCLGLYSNSAGTVITAGKVLVSKAIVGVVASLKDFNTKGGEGAIKFCTGLTDKFASTVRTAGKVVVSRAIEGIRSKLDEFKTQGAEAVSRFCSGLTGSSDKLRSAGQDMIDDAISAVRGHYSDFYDEGENAAKGYAQGIRDNAWRIGKAAGEATQEGINESRRIADSHSPSRVYRGLGHDAMEGYALGITDFATKVTDAVGDTATDGIYAMKDSIAKMDEMLDDNLDCSPTITPVMDLSALASGIKTGTGMLSSLNGVTTDIQSALSVAALHNEALARTKARNSRDYSADFEKLIDNTRRIVDAAKQNKVAVINGDYLFNYVNTRMGMA